MNPLVQTLSRTAWIADFMGGVWAATRFAERSLGPVADLAIRLWLAQIFLVSAVLKVSNGTMLSAWPATSTRCPGWSRLQPPTWAFPSNSSAQCSLHWV